MAIWVNIGVHIEPCTIAEELKESPEGTLELLACMAAEYSDPADATAFAKDVAQSSGWSIAEKRVAPFLRLLADAMEAGGAA